MKLLIEKDEAGGDGFRNLADLRMGMGVRALQAAGHRADTGAEVGSVRDGMFRGHAGHMLPERVPPARGDLLGEHGSRRAQHQPRREHHHTNRSS
jgi:hypothetical protein